jgi:hypothetical protein
VETLANLLLSTRATFVPKKKRNTGNDRDTNLFFSEFNIFRKTENTKLSKKFNDSFWG